MIEPIADMPEGTVGFRASGKVSAEEYREVLEPALRAAAEAGEVRFLYLLENDVDLALGAMAEDAKTGLGIGIGHRSAWRRMAIVTDVDWLRRAVHLFAWMVPGEMRVAEADQFEDAKAWVAE